MGKRVWVWVCDDEASARFPVYTRGNVGEVYSEVVSPLTWSAYGVGALEAGYRDGLYEMACSRRRSSSRPASARSSAASAATCTSTCRLRA
jgi:hypothetical protein